MSKLITLAVLATLSGQLFAVSNEEVDTMAKAAETAVDEGQWNKALGQWDAVIEAAESVDSAKSFLAILYYEQGRAAGVTCQWQRAEVALTKAFALDVETDGPTFFSLLELARMNSAKGDYVAAEKFFLDVLPILGKKDAALIDPVGSADIMDDFIFVLVQLGKDELAKKLTAQSAELRADYAKYAAETRKTPYGTKCE